MTDPDEHWNDAMDNDWNDDEDYPEDNVNLMHYVNGDDDDSE